MNNKKDFVTIKWIYQVSGSALWWTACLIVVRVLQGVTSIWYAYGLKRVVDSAQSGLGDAFYRNLWLFVALVATTVLLQVLGRYFTEKSKTVLDKAFRKHTFSQLIRRDYAQITRVHTGEWMNRFTSDTHVVSVAVATIVPDALLALMRMLGAAWSLFVLAPQIVYILLPCSLLMVVFSYIIRKWVKHYHRQMQQADGKVRSFVQERLYSLLVVRSFTQENATEQMGEVCMNELASVRMKRFHFYNLTSTMLSFAVYGAQVLGIGLCGWGILTGRMTYGTMSSVLYLIGMVEGPVANISSYVTQYYSMLASAERLMEIEEFPLDTVNSPQPAEVVRHYYEEQLVSFGLENTCFGYEDGEENLVLRNFNMDIRKGEFVAFTGESGCGKSTAMKTLLNLYSLHSGGAYLRDRDGKQQLLDATWRGMFAYVPQGNQLISGTVRETVTFSDPELMKQDDAIYAALKVACAEDFVRELPNGLDTVLGERGSGLSEGQMQRLSVARAVLSGRPVLLLDEATSALDAATEEQLLKNIRAMTDRTVLIITHREVALDFCDKRIHFERPC